MANLSAFGGFDPNQEFDTSSLIGPANLQNTLIGWLQRLQAQPTDFSGVNNLFSTLMQPGLNLGPNGIMTDPRQNLDIAGQSYLKGRANTARQGQQNQRGYQGLESQIAGPFSQSLNNITSLENQASQPTGVLGLFSSLLGNL